MRSARRSSIRTTREPRRTGSPECSHGEAAAGIADVVAGTWPAVGVSWCLLRVGLGGPREALHYARDRPRNLFDQTGQTDRVSTPGPMGLTGSTTPQRYAPTPRSWPPWPEAAGDLRSLGDLGYEGEADTITVAFKKPKQAPAWPSGALGLSLSVDAEQATVDSVPTRPTRTERPE